jgi:alpha-ribazole phosphatase
MEVFFIRHGITDANTNRLFAGGGLDVPVSEQGKAEARDVSKSAVFNAPFLAATGGRGVDFVYTSPMIRAKETASILFPAAKQEVVEDLREFMFGSFEGRGFGELHTDPAFIEWTRGDVETRCPDGDSVSSCAKRVSAAFTAIANERFARGDQSPIVMVAHGVSAMAFLYAFIDKEKPFFTWKTPNCGVWHFDCGLADGALRLTLKSAPPEDTQELRAFYGI